MTYLPEMVLGIDIGSVSASVVHMTTERRILQRAYAFHYGDIAGTLANLLSEFDLSKPAWVAASASTPETVKATARFDDQICCITAARQQQPDARGVRRGLEE